MDVLVGWPGGDWQSTAKVAGALVGSYLGLLWVASILWAYRDIRGRTRDPVSHIVAVGIVGVLPLVGLPIYFALRPDETLQAAYDRQLEQESILSELHSVSACPNCRRPGAGRFHGLSALPHWSEGRMHGLQPAHAARVEVLPLLLHRTRNASAGGADRQRRRCRHARRCQSCRGRTGCRERAGIASTASVRRAAGRRRRARRPLATSRLRAPRAPRRDNPRRGGPRTGSGSATPEAHGDRNTDRRDDRARRGVVGPSGGVRGGARECARPPPGDRAGDRDARGAGRGRD